MGILKLMVARMARNSTTIGGIVVASILLVGCITQPVSHQSLGGWRSSLTYRYARSEWLGYYQVSSSSATGAPLLASGDLLGLCSDCPGSTQVRIWLKDLGNLPSTSVSHAERIAMLRLQADIEHYFGIAKSESDELSRPIPPNARFNESMNLWYEQPRYLRAGVDFVLLRKSLNRLQSASKQSGTKAILYEAAIANIEILLGDISLRVSDPQVREAIKLSAVAFLNQFFIVGLLTHDYVLQGD